MGRWTMSDSLMKDSRSIISGGFTMAVEVASYSLGTGEVDTRCWPNSASELAAAADTRIHPRKIGSLRRSVGRECVS